MKPFFVKHMSATIIRTLSVNTLQIPALSIFPRNAGEHMVRGMRPFLHAESLYIHQILKSILVGSPLHLIL